MHALKRLIYHSGYPFLLACWFIIRPHTHGVKVVIERDGQVLLVRHSYGHPAWSFPGGGKKRGETLEHAAIRESKEETGLILPTIEFIGSFVTEKEWKKDHVHVYVAQDPRGDVSIDHEEIVGYEWATYGEERRWSPLGEKIWQMYLAHRGRSSARP